MDFRNFKEVFFSGDLIYLCILICVVVLMSFWREKWVVLRNVEEFCEVIVLNLVI